MHQRTCLHETHTLVRDIEHSSTFPGFCKGRLEFLHMFQVAEGPVRPLELGLAVRSPAYTTVPVQIPAIVVDPLIAVCLSIDETLLPYQGTSRDSHLDTLAFDPPVLAFLLTPEPEGLRG